MERASRLVRTLATANFIMVVKDIPFSVLNAIVIWKDNNVQANLVFSVSAIFSLVALGYKVQHFPGLLRAVGARRTLKALTRGTKISISKIPRRATRGSGINCPPGPAADTVPSPNLTGGTSIPSNEIVANTGSLINDASLKGVLPGGKKSRDIDAFKNLDAFVKSLVYHHTDALGTFLDLFISRVLLKLYSCKFIENIIAQLLLENAELNTLVDNASISAGVFRRKSYSSVPHLQALQEIEMTSRSKLADDEAEDNAVRVVDVKMDVKLPDDLSPNSALSTPPAPPTNDTPLTIPPPTIPAPTTPSDT
jgi:hypothetical protein